MALDSSLNLTDPHEFDPDTTIIGTLWCIRGVELGWEVIFESAPVDASGNVVEAESELIDAFGAANGQWLVIRYNDPSETRAYRVIVEGAGCDQSCPSDWVKAQPTEVPLPLPECSRFTGTRPKNDDLVLWWRLDEANTRPIEWGAGECDPPRAEHATSDRIYHDSSGHQNHGFMYTFEDSVADYDSDAERWVRAPGPQSGVANRGWGHQQPINLETAPDAENGSGAGAIAVNPVADLAPCAGGLYDHSDFYPTTDLTVTLFYRPWLWAPDADLITGGGTFNGQHHRLFGRWSGGFNEGVAVGLTGGCDVLVRNGGFYWQMLHYDTGPSGEFEEWIEAFHQTSTDRNDGYWIFYKYPWSGVKVSEYVTLERQDAILAPSWRFFSVRYSPIKPNGTTQVDVFVGDVATGKLDKLCCDLTGSGSEITDACNAPPAHESQGDRTGWALGVNQMDAESGPDCGVLPDPTARMHFDDHRRYNSALTDAEIRWLFLNPGKA